MLEEMTERIAASFDIEKQLFRRQLGPEELIRLRDVCSAAFSSEIDLNVLDLIAQYCAFVESKMRGRAAGHIEDLVIRYLFRYFASLIDTKQYERPCHMEIGVLFGAATIYAYHATQLASRDTGIVAIDPFEGYYGIEKDPLTNIRVDEETFLDNLRLFSIPVNRIDIIKDYSTTDETIERCRDKQVLSLLIDGDHSYEGVKNDWLNYSPLVVPGGYVLIDDYNNTKKWPGIFNCLNKEILPHLWGKWEIALIYGSSIILRRTSVKEDRDLSDFRNLYRELTTYEKRVRELEETAKAKGVLEQENKRLKETVRRMEHSLSWMVTAPLRKMKRIWEE
jgi:hypothetical protein